MINPAMTEQTRLKISASVTIHAARIQLCFGHGPLLLPPLAVKTHHPGPRASPPI
jgi:hypothetical protein